MNDTVVWINSFNHANSTVHTQWLRLAFLFSLSFAFFFYFDTVFSLSMYLDWVCVQYLYKFIGIDVFDIHLHVRAYGILPVHAHCRRTWCSWWREEMLRREKKNEKRSIIDVLCAFHSYACHLPFEFCIITGKQVWTTRENSNSIFFCCCSRIST